MTGYVFILVYVDSVLQELTLMEYSMAGKLKGGYIGKVSEG